MRCYPQEVRRGPWLERGIRDCSPLYHPAIPSVLSVFHRQSIGLVYSAPRTRPVRGSITVFSEVRICRIFELTVIHPRENRICGPDVSAANPAGHTASRCTGVSATES